MSIVLRNMSYNTWVQIDKGKNEVDYSLALMQKNIPVRIRRGLGLILLGTSK